MKTLIKKWGNSAAVRLPSSMLQSMHISINSEVEIEEFEDKIVITPVSKSYDLNELLDGINEDNLHEEVSLGKPIGKESL
ncbi:AbrB/MazE/SpoVT family DNA-binding domain-containing protein [Thiotrichales bacterium 19X7-9]|nr:AbrB/MazE/SpoVT family DNA-binding domain-containing protein [Thiotrichales bacterium 19X7-9]